MPRFRLTRRAARDLRDIFAYGYRVFGRAQADRYGAGLAACFELLAENPRLGRPADTIGMGVRRHEHRRHVVLYEEEPGGVLILAVVHERRVIKLDV